MTRKTHHTTTLHVSQASAGLMLLCLLSTPAAMAEADGLQTVQSYSPELPMQDQRPDSDPFPLDPLAETDNPIGTLNQRYLDRNEASNLYRQLTEQARYTEALDAAELAVELTEQAFGPADAAMGPVLTDLGFALLQVGQPAVAQGVFERSVAISDQQQGIFSRPLVSALHGLGLSLQQQGEHDQAIGTFHRAQHVSHRNDGVINLEQVPIIAASVDSYLAENRGKEAENLQLSILKIYQRKFGKGTIGTVPGLHRTARWFHDIQDYRQARLLYRQAMRIKTRQVEEDSIALLPEMKGITVSYLEENGPDAIKGLRMQRRIVEVIENNLDEVSLNDRILAHLEMGDWYVMYNETEDAHRTYKRAWALAQTDTDNLDYWTGYFNQTAQIYPGPPLSIDMLGYGYVGKEVYYDFRFTISREGRPVDVAIIGTNLHGMNRIAATTAFKMARFRPRLIDGEVIASPNTYVRRIFPTDPPDDYGVTLGD